ncbi:MAG: hypothetical protein ABSB96_02900 [Gaiellaceae bacterium]
MIGFSRLGALLLIGAVLSVVALAGATPGSARSSEVDVAVAVSAGADHSCALMKSGGIECWGGNSNGQLGDGTTENRLTPVEVKGIDDAIEVAAGEDYTCAILHSHRMRCWGQNEYGELGDGTTTDRHTPVTVDGVADVRAMSLTTSSYFEANSTCALVAGGEIDCWGANSDGELGYYPPEQTSGNSDSNQDGSDQGDNGVDFSLKPVAVKDITARALSDNVDEIRCAVLDTGEVACWGGDYYGYGVPVSDSTDQQDTTTATATTTTTTPAYSGNPIKGISGATDVVLNDDEDGCVLKGDGSVECWVLSADEEPPKHMDIPDATQLTYGEGETCALLSRGTLSCWTDDFGELSDPKPVEGVEGVRSIDGGNSDDRGPFNGHFCAVFAGGQAKCWGDGYSGELGNGVSAHHSTPVLVSGLEGATSIGTGGGHTCASLIVKGEAVPDKFQVECWGANQLGQLGDAKAKHGYSSKVEVSPLPVTAIRMDNAISVAVGWWHACALVGDLVDDPYSEGKVVQNGSVKCWGAGRRGQLGLGKYLYNLKSGWIMSRYPRAVKDLKDVTAVAAGGNVSCALISDGSVDCWGGWFAPAPVAVPGVTGATAISVAQDGKYMCALIAGGQVECWSYKLPSYYWGDEEDGASTPEFVSQPTAVPGISGATAIDATSACAVVNGAVQCWSPQKSRLVATVSGIQNAASLKDDCAVSSDGQVACWTLPVLKEDDEGNEIEDASDAYQAQPLERVTGAAAFSETSNRDWREDHACALLGSGVVECWGDNFHGELGNGELPFSDKPVGVIGLSESS